MIITLIYLIIVVDNKEDLSFNSLRVLVMKTSIF